MMLAFTLLFLAGLEAVDFQHPDYRHDVVHHISNDEVED